MTKTKDDLIKEYVGKRVVIRSLRIAGIVENIDNDGLAIVDIENRWPVRYMAVEISGLFIKNKR